MPFLSIQSNIKIEENQQITILKTLSQAVSELLGKPEQYVMIALSADQAMTFAGNDAPMAYIELKSLGLPEDKTADFSAGLCQLIEGLLKVPQERIYIEFAGPARHMWGWNGATF